MCALTLGGCFAGKPVPESSAPAGDMSTVPTKESPGSGEARCQPGEVTLENYGDKGRKLANCFVEYPGEPSREDKNYYIVEDICGQFTSDFVSGLIGKPAVKAKAPDIAGLYNCSYYFSDSESDYVMLNLEYLSAANQQKGQEVLGRRVEKREDIPMDNLVVWQEDGQINDVLLVLNPNKFIGIKRGATTVLDNDQLLAFARALASEIKEYK